MYENTCDEGFLRKARSVIRRVLSVVYGDKYYTILLYHLRKTLRLENTSLTRLFIEDPMEVYKAMKVLYGGEDVLDSFLTLTLSAVNKVLGLTISPKEIVKAMKTGNSEVIVEYLKLLVWYYEKSSGI